MPSSLHLALQQKIALGTYVSYVVHLAARRLVIRIISSLEVPHALRLPHLDIIYEASLQMPHTLPDYSRQGANVCAASLI